jgi:hypothetical protein
VCENRELRRISESKREEVAGRWRKLCNEKLHKFFCASDFIRLIKSKKMEAGKCIKLRRNGKCIEEILIAKPDGKIT